MPALPPVPSTFRLRTVFTLGSDASTGWHVYMNSGGSSPTQGQINQMALQWATGLQSHLAAFWHPSVIMTEVVVTDLSAPTAAVGVWAGSQPGTRTGGELAANAAVLLNFPVARRYRGGKPRAYALGGTATDLQNPQTWTTTFTSGYLSGFNACVSDFKSVVASWAPNMHQVAVSYYAGHEWRQDQNLNWHRVPIVRDTPVIDAVQTVSVNPFVASQRRRLA